MMTTSRWSKAEELLVVALYRRLLVAEQNGAPLDVTKELLATRGIAKSPGAIRNRLQNISAVLEENGVAGGRNLAPWRNAAKQTKETVEASLPW